VDDGQVTIPLDTLPADVPAKAKSAGKPRKRSYWSEYAELIAEVMTACLKRPITPWVIAGPSSYIALAFRTHAKGDDGKRLEGGAFRAWLDKSIRTWLRWRRGVGGDDGARALTGARKTAWWKGETGVGWVAWLDGGGA
jgi:hypothetical protein